MSSPIPIPYTPSGLYVPVHKRNRSTSSSYSSTRSLSPLSSRGFSPLPSAGTLSSLPGRTQADPTTAHHGVYTLAELLSLAHSHLARVSGSDINTRLRAVAPEVVLTHKQRKALEWHARHAPTPTATTTGSHRRGRLSRPHASESEEESTTWRKT